MRKGCCDECDCGCPLGYEAESKIRELEKKVEQKEKAIVKAFVLMGALETVQLEIEVDRKERIQKMLDEFKKALEGGEGK